MNRYFFFQDDKSHKFWEVEWSENLQAVHFGRMGTRGQSNEKVFDSPEACEKDTLKVIAEKLKKGYAEVAASNRPASELLLKEIGGTTPIIRFEEGLTYLIVEMPFFFDENGNPIDGEDDFPEANHFELILSKYLGKPVEREDREVFYMEDAGPADVEKLKFFMENYWSLRDGAVKKYDPELYKKVVDARERLNGEKLG